MSVYDIQIGTRVTGLKAYENQFVLVVNIADQCGFSPQLKALEALHANINLPCHVIAFPCNQFKQQSRDDVEMQQWCAVEQLTFTVEKQIDVNGANTHELFRYLKMHAKGAFGQQAIVWNYTKFLILPNEREIKRFAPNAAIQKVESYIMDYHDK